jgi:predicted transcriptional regulator
MMEQVRAVDTEQPRNVGLDLSQEIERLKREHRELKARLSELNSRLHLSIDEEIERKKIQKLKLLKKDQLLMLEAKLHN